MSARADTPILSMRTAIIAVAVGVVSFASVIILSAFAPDLENRDRAGLHAYSTSALGYNFAFNLLQQVGYETSISRNPAELQTRVTNGLLILTPASGYDADELEDVQYYRGGYPTLIVLPKRTGYADRTNPRHYEQTSLYSIGRVEPLVDVLNSSIELTRVESLNSAIINGRSHALDLTGDVQVMRSNALLPILSNGDDVLLGRLAGENTYILSEPELFNTHGLSKLENARVMEAFMTEIMHPKFGNRIVFDTTLHGFERNRNLLRLLFQPPILGATIFAFATALLLGWSAFLRFGRPTRPEQAVATGRQSLIESTAGLFRQTEKEASLAGDYEDLARRQAISAIGYREELSKDQMEEVLHQRDIRLQAAEPDAPKRPDTGSVGSPAQLVQFAKEFHAWKRKLTDECE